MTKPKNANKKPVHKVGIYVPENRVAELKEYRPSMNLSKMFWAAFDREKHRLDCLPKKEEQMTDLIERLRNSRRKHAAASEAQGFTAGSEWATKEAEFHELISLDERNVELREVLTSADVLDALDADDWGWLVGEDVEVTEDFVTGFVAGAISVLRQAREGGL